MSRWRYPLALFLLCLVFLSLSLWHLGSRSFPRSGWTAGAGAEVVLDLGSPQKVERVLLLPLQYGGVNLRASCGSPGAWQAPISFQGQGEWKQWLKLSPNCTTRYLLLEFQSTTAPLGEIAVLSGDRLLPIACLLPQNGAEGAAALVDEQKSLGRLPSYQRESYFDEIYFARSAEQYLRLELPFEWTHPPLGKLIIASGIAVFGSTPFGWRISGAIFATLTLVLVFLLGRQLLGSPRAGLLAAFLVAFDFLHYTESRLATGETFLFTFLVLMFLFFAYYYRTHQVRYLFLTLVAFGLAFAVKWVALFGLVGVLVLLALRWRQIGKRQLLALAGGAGAAGAIYLLSYIPDLLAGRSLAEVYRLQFSMYGYHAELRAEHPSGAPWWSWPVMLRPLWLYLGEGAGFRSLIVGLGNPALWWGALPFLGWLVWRGVRRREWIAAFILAPFLAQWLLFIPIPRVLFIYHYYPNVLFLALGLAWGLEQRGKRWHLAFLIAVLVLFALFFPFISGLEMPQAYWQKLDLLVRWVT